MYANVKLPVYRPFTVEQSSAIANIEIDENFVEIIFHSNTERAYLFKGSDTFVAHLTEVIQSPDLLGLSLGKVISDARKCGDLEYFEEGGY